MDSMDVLLTQIENGIDEMSNSDAVRETSLSTTGTH